MRLCLVISVYDGNTVVAATGFDDFSLLDNIIMVEYFKRVS